MRLVRLLSVLLLVVACINVPVQSQTAVASTPVQRITAPIDETNRVALPGNVHPLAQARFDVGAAPGSMATGRILLVIQRSAAQQQALTQYLADVQNPSSPSFHKWLTPAQYGAAFGIGDSDLQTVESWLQAQGFKVEKVPQGRNVIQFSGTVGQVASAFHTSIHAFSVAGATHYANISDPQIPAALAPVVAGVGPLNDFRPKPEFIKGGTGHWDAATHRIVPDLTLFNGSGEPFLFVDPADAATIYDTPNTSLNANYTSGTTYDGTGVNLGIVGVSDLTVADVQNYRVAFMGETSSNVNLPTVIVDGEDPGLNGAGIEALLDNEVSGGIAPKAKVYFYTSADSDIASGLYNAVLRAIDDNTVSILSMSFGQCEAGLGTAGNAFLLETSQQAAAQGISWTVSAGDGGSAGCDDFDTEEVAQYGLAVSGMASTPWVIAVGGTDFDVLPTSFTTYVTDTTSGAAPYYRTAQKYIPENPWNNSTTVDTLLANDVAATNGLGETNIVAGSGGVSLVYSKPAFQTSITLADSARDVPDVSLFASDGNKQAFWLVCSDNVTDGDPLDTFTDCQTSGGVLQNGTSFLGVGGTSASAPAFAGMLALVSQSQGGARLGQADFVLYQLAKSKYATVFHDVTVGNNSVPCKSGSVNCGTNGFLTGYNTGTGYDVATGLGSVDVNQLVKNWSSVALTATSTSFKINGSTAAYSGTHGATLTFNVGVTPTAATGAVAVIDTANQTSGGTTSGPQNDGQVSIPLTSGAGTATYNGLPGGTYTVSARYGGDTSDASSSSTPAISVTIAAEASTTSLEVNAYNAQTGISVGSLSSIPYGSFVFDDAQITGTAEGSKTEGVATGTVAFTDGSSALATVKVSGNGNQATWPPDSSPYSVFAVGAHSVTAKYSGDASYNASTSPAVAFTVVKGATSMTAVGGSPVNAESYTYANVTITTPYNLGVAPTGTVTMTANGATLGTITGLLSGINISGTTILYQLTGTGQIFGGNLAPGNNVVTLTYSGDGNYASTHHDGDYLQHQRRGELCDEQQREPDADGGAVGE
jgi:subtilase family serine protease